MLFAFIGSILKLILYSSWEIYGFASLGF